MDSFYTRMKNETLEMKVKCCFVIDATGSMGPWIEAAKTQTSTIMNDIRNKYTDIELQIAAVFYRDYGDSERILVMNFTENCEKFTNDIQEITAFGGDDICEDVAGGFKAAVELNWDDADVKNLFLICDAPPHGNSWHSIGISDKYPDDENELGIYISNLVEKNIKLSIVKINNSIDKMIRKMTIIYGKPIPVSDLFCKNEIFEPDPSFNCSLMTPQEYAFNRSITSQIDESIRESQSEH